GRGQGSRKGGPRPPPPPPGGCRPVHTRGCSMLPGLAAFLAREPVSAAAPPAPPPPPPGPAYQIVLRSRTAEVTPTRCKDAQTGGGSIVVEQPEPNTIVITMGGSAVVGSDFHGSAGGRNVGLGQGLGVVPRSRE